MGKFQDLTGQVFGYLLVLGIAYKKPVKPHGSIIYWRCRCLKCGNECVVRAADLKNGQQSCGCGRLEAITTHGMSNTSIYNTWRLMIQRCYNPNATGFDEYGGRGIKVCERWHKFENFYADVSKLSHFGEKGYTLDRIRVDEDYKPDNVRWASPKQQANNRRDNIRVNYNGEEMTLKEAAERSGIPYNTLQYRYYKGILNEKLFLPIDESKSHSKDTAIIVKYNGEEMTLKAAAAISGINYGTLKRRYHKGDRGDKLFRPARNYKKGGDKNENYSKCFSSRHIAVFNP